MTEAIDPIKDPMFEEDDKPWTKRMSNRWQNFIRAVSKLLDGTGTPNFLRMTLGAGVTSLSDYRDEGDLYSEDGKCYFGGGVSVKDMSIREDGSIYLQELSDADAGNSSFYYSTTQNKPVYKDSGGVVNNLY